MERLFHLLESGQSPFLRKSAAYQIGEIAKSHPNKLSHLLRQLRPLAIAASWDTRIAAAHTLESLMQHIGDDQLSEQQQQPKIEEDEDEEQLQTLAEFDLSSLIANGPRLLSSTTSKYDLKGGGGVSLEAAAAAAAAEAASLQQQQQQLTQKQLEEKIRQQRRLLNSKLGIDVGDAAKLDTSHIFSDYDLIVSSGSSVVDTPATSTSTTTTITASSVIKRRAASSTSSNSSNEGGGGGGGGESSSSPVVSAAKRLRPSKQEPVDDDDNEKQQQQQQQRQVKALGSFVKWLVGNLFEAEWETRHGAATCLREVVKRLVVCHERNNNNHNDNNNCHWFHVSVIVYFSAQRSSTIYRIIFE